MPTRRRPSPVHRPNGPYWPLGLVGGEYCVKCREAWPCYGAKDNDLARTN